MLQTFKHKIKSISMAKKLTLLLAVLIIAAMGVGSTFAYVITGTPSLVNLFFNGLSPDGNLTIEKTLTHPYGKNYSVPQGLAFTFDVDLGDEYANETLKTTQGDLTADADGILQLTIAPNGRVTIYDIDENTVVTVTETNLGPGFTAKEPSKDITIEKYKDNFLSFANTYAPQQAQTKDLTVGGTKTLEGRDWMDGDSFTFALEVYDGEKKEWVSLGEDTVTYKEPEPDETADSDFNKFDFTEMIQDYDFAQMGTYNFHVTEVEGTVGGITYDKSESYFDIVVGDKDMDGYLEIQDITSTSANTKIDGQTIAISFKNSYAPEGSAKVDIEIKKIMKDHSGQNLAPAGYTFELYDQAEQKVATSEPSKALGNTSLSLIFEPKDAGKTFVYTLKETDAGKEENGFFYDDKVYNLQVDVIDNLDGTVSAIIYEAPKADQTAEDASKDADAVFEAEFTNKYDPQDDHVTISGKKIVDGRKLFDKEFTFALYTADKDFDVPKDSEPIDTTANDEDGNFGFDTLSYDKVGTYYYVVKEDASNPIRGITYDKTRYFVTVEVTDKDGVLTAKKTISNDDGAAADIVFTNEYVAEPVSYTVTGTKTLRGADLQAKMFSFQLYAADEEFVQTGDAFRTALNDADGQFTFDALTFSAPGTYRYIVKEDTSAPAEHVTYDQRVYQVAIEVADRGTGQLSVEDVTYTVDGEAAESIELINTYKAPEPDQPIEPDDPSAPDDDQKEPDDGNPPTTPDEGDKPDGTTNDGEEPDTGDHSHLTLYATLLSVAAAALIALRIYRRKTMK